MGVGVTVRGLPAWCEPRALLGPGEWRADGHGAWVADLPRERAAAVEARLRGVGLDGRRIEVEVRPALKHALVRRARADDARLRRSTSPGFTHPGARLDDEGKVSLTPEALALRLGQRVARLRVIDATCGAGGNTIGFARAGCAVVGIDRDRRRLELAAHNAHLYGVADRVDLRCGLAEELVPALDGDVLFVDPPWGREWDRVRTTVDDLPLLAALLGQTRRFGLAFAKSGRR